MEKIKEVKVDKLPYCDFCKIYNIQPPDKATYDGKTKMGYWAYMCRVHFRKYGVGLGAGKGQRLIKEA